MNLEMLKLERQILSSKKFSRLQQISLVVDHMRVKDSAQTRASHSIEVANSVEIMNYFITKKAGFNTDRFSCGRVVGLLHDIGHTSYSHEGEKTLNKLTKKYSDNKIGFEGNANNYITIQKNNLLKGVSEEVKEYILASLAKHKEDLYEEQSCLIDIINNQINLEIEYLLNQGLEITSMDKTLQCQIMDIADENSYIISDIVDSLNIFSLTKLAEIFQKELPFEISEDLIKALYKGHNSFRMTLQKYHDMFCENFYLDSTGVVKPEKKDIEQVRMIMAMISKKYILKEKTVVKSRKIISKKINIVFSFFFNLKNANRIPSKFYRKEFENASAKEEKIVIIRNMLGSLTNKGLLKEFKKITR